MATGTARKTAAKKVAPKPPPVEVEDDELEEDDDDLEELEEDEVEEKAPKKAAAKKAGAVQQVEFGVSDLAAYITKKTGEKVDARGLRTLIRKMARDGSGRVTREIVAGNRTRYSWSGPTDPEVKRIVAAFEGGELEADKQEKLQQLKDRKAKGEIGKKPAKKAADARRRPKPVVEELEDDDEDLDEDE